MPRPSKRLAFLSALWLLACSLPLAAAPALQPLIDATPTGGILRPPPGVYAGPALITRPLVLDGGGKVTLDGEGRGTVLTLQTDGAVVRGMRIIRSGDSHDQMDAAILVQGDANLIEHNTLEEVLFGVFLRQSNDNRLRSNRIRSRHEDLAHRGDAVRLWYSRRNRIEGNEIAQARDLTLANSPHNRIVDNRIRDVRMAAHFIFSPRNLVQGNHISHAATGVVVINSEGVTVRRNLIQHVHDGGGAAVVFKESSSGLVDGNEIVHCSTGVLADSPSDPVNRITLYGNRLAHNITAINFYGEKGGHLIHRNRFENNLVQAMLTPGGNPLANEWLGNYWDDYQGFDRDRDGVGDVPHELYVYADRIWLEFPMARFFRNSPALELLDFLERLAPFSLPELALRDAAPQAHRRGKD
jgi:nitrous oxidase accessory protein